MFAYNIRVLGLVIMALLVLLVAGCASSPPGGSEDRLEIDPQTGEITQHSSEKNKSQNGSDKEEQIVQCSDGSMRMGTSDDEDDVDGICHN